MKLNEIIDFRHFIGGGWIPPHAVEEYIAGMFDIVSFLKSEGQVFCDVPDKPEDMPLDFKLTDDQMGPLAKKMLYGLPFLKYMEAQARGTKRENRLKKFVKAYEELKADQAPEG